MSTSDITATNQRDVYARVTAQIINAIEQGVGTWRMPWHASGRYVFSPINVASKKPIAASIPCDCGPQRKPKGMSGANGPRTSNGRTKAFWPHGVVPLVLRDAAQALTARQCSRHKMP
jgi:hypothetical protein